MNVFSQIDKSWTLFLDRDGVINHEIQKQYVLDWGGFTFYEGVKEAIGFLSGVFGKVIVVTNQRGISKGLMTENDLADIHAKMILALNESSGRIDKIYYCSALDDSCMERKPNPGMAYLAKTDFPEIDFSKSIMIGNKPSDMKFGRNAGMYTIFIASTNPEVPFPNDDIDFRYDSLSEAALAIEAALIHA